MSPEWDTDLLRDPHAAPDKRRRVQRMFSAIAPSYDLNNRVHSLWMDQQWRKKAVVAARLQGNETVLDVACGTGDLTLQFSRALIGMGGDAAAPLGIDFTYEMLPIARQKSDSTGVRAKFSTGDAQSLPLADGCCDVVSIAFGIRNVAEPSAALAEFRRVLRPGGRLIVLEFSLPTQPVLRGLYNFYFRKILPRTATLISGDTSGAYRYLPESVNTFIGREQMMEMMAAAGFSEVKGAADDVWGVRLLPGIGGRMTSGRQAGDA